jgi:hypothetical protein
MRRIIAVLGVAGALLVGPLASSKKTVAVVGASSVVIVSNPRAVADLIQEADRVSVTQ